jgi:prophage regulatory protein
MSESKLSILRLNDVMKRTGLSRSTIYAYIDKGAFPKPFKIGDRAVGWYEHVIDEWMASKGGYKPAGHYDGK